MMGIPSSKEVLDERKAKIMSFVEKDIFVVNNYESAPFKNKNHAIECLIPYHIFQAMVDDVKFKGSDVEIDLRKGLSVLEKKVLELYEETCFRNENFTPQLLLYHEQRYINSILRKRAQEAEECPKPLASEKLRIKRSNNIPAFGPPNRLRLKCPKPNNTEK